MTMDTDIVVIGAGIAGASVAARLAPHASVVLLEREDQPGYHSTGRSAATFVPGYGPPSIISLTSASRSFFMSPDDGFCDGPLLSPRGILMIGGEGDGDHVREAQELGMVQMSLDEAKDRVPPLKTDAVSVALIDEGALDIDVDLLHQGFLREFRRLAGQLHCRAEVKALSREGTGWLVETSAGDWRTPLVVNAAGAWCDAVAALAGVRPVGLQPKRRSAALITPPDSWDISNYPLVFGAGETFYFKPMSGKLMVSPADATVVEPHDAWADDMLIAEAIDKFQQVMDVEVRRLDHTWGGLRTFGSDGDPVVGYDPEVSGFFWLAGQGGYGIQTSPTLSRLAAALALSQTIPGDIVAAGVDVSALSPARFHGAAV